MEKRPGFMFLRRCRRQHENFRGIVPVYRTVTAGRLCDGIVLARRQERFRCFEPCLFFRRGQRGFGQRFFGIIEYIQYRFAPSAYQRGSRFFRDASGIKVIGRDFEKKHPERFEEVLAGSVDSARFHVDGFGHRGRERHIHAAQINALCPRCEREVAG